VARPFVNERGDNVAYVVPNTAIYLLSDVPLSSDQRDTYYFTSASQQQAYFRSKIAFTFTEQSYQRVNVGKVRVQLNPAENIYQCNYMMFTNTNHWDGKWFYAFIMRIEYINENCAEITYKIDALQSWLFDYTEEQCLIKRQSPSVDYLGSNLQPEPFDCGTYVCNNTWVPQSWDTGESYQGDYIGVLYLDNMQNNDGGLCDNVFTAAQLWVFHANSSGVSRLNDFIDGHIKSTVDGVTSYYPDNIIGIYMMPHECFPKGIEPGNGVHISLPKSNSRWTYEIPGCGRGVALDGYVPKYQKLYTAPFTNLCIDMGNGQSMLLQYEMFEGVTEGEISFAFEANSIPPCALTIYPMKYKHDPATDFYSAEQISTGEYPLCSWSTDYWTAYLGQTSTLPLTEHHTEAPTFLTPQSVNVAQVQSDVSKALLPALQNLQLGKTVGTMFDLTHAIPENIVNGRDIYESLLMSNPDYRKSDIVKGTVYNGNNWYGHNNRKHVHFRRMSVTHEYAEKIDKYFDAFGYAVNTIGTPNKVARTKYTYVQTMGCEVRGRITTETKNEIARIYDNGIRFWNYANTGDTLGTYDIANNNSTS
jgi:hypothetical protein